MLKWIGVALSAAACVALGFGVANAVGARVRTLGELCRAMRLLSRRVTLLSEPMKEALDALRFESPVFGRVLSHMDEPPYTAWQIALKQQKELSEADAAIIARIAADSGKSGRAEQERIFEAGLELLEEREKSAREKAVNDKKLYRTLGILAAVVIILVSL